MIKIDDNQLAVYCFVKILILKSFVILVCTYKIWISLAEHKWILEFWIECDSCLFTFYFRIKGSNSTWIPDASNTMTCYWICLYFNLQMIELLAMNLLFITLLLYQKKKCLQFVIEDKLYLNVISSLNTSNQ